MTGEVLITYVGASYGSSLPLVYGRTQYQLSSFYEGILWIYGHHPADSEEGRALLAAYALWKSRA